MASLIGGETMNRVMVSKTQILAEVYKHYFLLNCGQILSACTSGSSIWSRGGGPRNFFRDFADVAKRSQASEASQYWPGSRARLRALEALAFLTIKYAFSHFSWYFFFKFLMYICIGTLLNIYFNMRDSGDFDKCNFWSLYLRKSRILVVPLV